MAMTCLLVGGIKASQLGNYIEENSGKSVTIDYVLTSFTADADKLNRLMIRTSKLVWLINESTNIRSDLDVLNTCMQNRTYFRVGEIFIFGVRDETTIEAERLFRLLMEENEFSSYSIVLKDEPSSFPTIYRELMGTAETETASTKRKMIYRTTRSDSSKRGYDPEEYDSNIELAENDNNKQYEKIKQVAIKTETNQIIKESPNREVPKIDLNITNIDVSEVKHKKNVFIVCGKPKAGASTLAFNLTKFLMEQNKRVNLVDISTNFGSAIMAMSKLKAGKIEGRALVDNVALLTGKVYDDQQLAVYSTFKLHDRGLLTSYLKYVLSIPNRTTCDCLVIDCCIDDVEEVMNLCGSRIVRVFVSCQDVREELVVIKRKVETIVRTGNNHTVFLNRSINYGKDADRVTEVDAKKIIKNGKFTGFVNFETEEADFSELVKVVN